MVFCSFVRGRDAKRGKIRGGKSEMNGLGPLCIGDTPSSFSEIRKKEEGE